MWRHAATCGDRWRQAETGCAVAFPPLIRSCTSFIDVSITIGMLLSSFLICVVVCHHLRAPICVRTQMVSARATECQLKEMRTELQTLAQTLHKRHAHTRTSACRHVGIGASIRGLLSPYAASCIHLMFANARARARSPSCSRTPGGRAQSHPF
jgi:hypothetical protein